jgi:hypothetical protein
MRAEARLPRRGRIVVVITRRDRALLRARSDEDS